MSLMTCPLCGETEFDRYGLAMHYANEWCEAVNAEAAAGPPEKRPTKDQDGPRDATGGAA